MYNEEELMRITDVKGIAKYVGKDVANEMMIPIKEMKEFIKPSEVASIILQYSMYKNGQYYLNYQILQKIFNETKNRVVGIQLAKLAADGKLETIWDEENNCMTFKSN